ncbi:MAG: hypothetical protein JWN37_689 [Candidatus Nomurabacteria bacterium]|nr:hypothetical protein [Candidatus Nomurabacteria bacterium]
MKFMKLGAPLLAISLLAGAGAGIASLASAQSTGTTGSTTTASVQSTATANTNPNNTKAQGHAPLGGDGNITSINGTTIVMTEEADEGGAAYTIDASTATVTKDGVASTLANLAIGDKIFVKGVTTGTNIVATNISSGMHGGHYGPKGTRPADATGQ